MECPRIYCPNKTNTLCVQQKTICYFIYQERRLELEKRQQEREKEQEKEREKRERENEIERIKQEIEVV